MAGVACVFSPPAAAEFGDGALPLVGAELYYYPDAFSAADAATLFTQLQRQIRWQQLHITLYGKKFAVPRLSVWHGARGAGYAYSGLPLRPQPWTPLLLRVKQRVEALAVRAFGKSPNATSEDGFFNCVLVNRYRDRRDSVAWHADDEPELGPTPVIASVSLGAERVFELRPKPHFAATVGLKTIVHQTGQIRKMHLAHGSCLLMGGRTQTNWLHRLPKSPRPVSERINLTFRRVLPESGAEMAEAGAL